MSDTGDFRDLLQRVRAGDPDAAVEVVRRYEPAIRRAVRVRLADDRLERLFDSMDICQSVLGSFFVRANLGQYELAESDDLLKLLVRMARNKLAEHARHEAADCRDYRRVAGSGLDKVQAPAPDASPSQELELRELTARFRELLSPEEQELAAQRAQGQAWAELAAARGTTPEALRKQFNRTIERVSQRLGLAEAGDA